MLSVQVLGYVEGHLGLSHPVLESELGSAPSESMDAAVKLAGQTAGRHFRKTASYDDAEPLTFPTRANSCFGSLTFEFRSSDQIVRQLTSDHQNQFKADFHREAARLEEWTAARGWPAPAIPNVQVTVSDQFKISKALVPAWNGRAGHMEFPSWRVAHARPPSRTNWSMSFSRTATAFSPKARGLSPGRDWRKPGISEFRQAAA